nr:RING finger protein 17-like [Onthophagus taurus]XP_022902762.1 RING finger protein 17-like [Onthophagus taurus]XP_022902763.1 RING finger protein 17-like [Onthophagus taurus]
MDRLKEAILSNTETLQQEIHEINTRLNNIIHQNKKVSKQIKSLNYHDFISNKDYCLKICTQQSNIINDLHVTNIQLEQYQLGNKSLKLSPSKIVTSSKKEIKQSVLINYNESTSDSNEPSPSEEISSTDSKIELTPNESVINKLKQYGLLKQQKIDEVIKANKPDLTFKKCGNSKTIKKSVSKMIKEDSKTTEIEYFEGNLKPALAPSKMMSCLISHIVSPSEFYINYFGEDIEAIERISSDYSSNHDSPEFYFLTKSEAKSNLKTYCLCYIDSWQFWFRAKIINWLDDDSDSDDVEVFLVDYGNTVRVTFKNLRPLLKKYGDIPEYAIKCHLAHLYPVGSTPQNQLINWPQDAITGLKNILGPENQFFFKVVYVDRFKNSWGIDLAKTLLKDDTDKEVGQQLIDNNLCVEILELPNSNSTTEGFIQSQVETAQGFEGISSEMTDNEKLETFCKNLDVNEPKNLDEALVGYKASDQARTCQVYLRHGSCYKLPNCRFDHEPLRRDGYTTDKVEVHIGTTLNMELPEEGVTFPVRITSIISLTRWYGNLSTKMTTFNQLSEQLNNPILIQKYKKFNLEPGLAELVVVKIETSTEPNLSKWCRGKILDVTQHESSPEDIITVFLVDIGETIQTNKSNLRLITKDLLYLPFQAVSLTIHGIKPKEGVCDKEIIEYCEKNFVGRNLTATVLHKSSDNLVVSIGLNSRRHRDVDVAELIINDGYGVHSDDCIQLKKDFSLKYELSLD